MKQIRREVRRLRGYHLETPSCRVKLNQNESPFDLPAAVKRKILDRLGDLQWNRYPTPYCDSLRKKVALREGWDANGVIVSGGSNVLIQAILIAASVGAKVMTVRPGFALYRMEAALLGNKVTEVPLNPSDFSLPIDPFLRKIKKERPKVVFIANPNAPTGNLFLEKDLVAILRASSGLVVIDEAYFPFSGFTLFSILRRFKNLILLRTFSKAFSLGGVRLGTLLADPSIAHEILKVMVPFTVGLLSQAVGEAVLEEDGFVAPLVDRIVREREYLYQGLKGMRGLKVFPSRANFLLFQSPRSKTIFSGLLEQGILIRDVTSPDLPDALRVTVGTGEENRVFLEAMAKL